MGNTHVYVKVGEVIWRLSSLNFGGNLYQNSSVTIKKQADMNWNPQHMDPEFQEVLVLQNIRDSHPSFQTFNAATISISLFFPINELVWTSTGDRWKLACKYGGSPQMFL